MLYTLYLTYLDNFTRFVVADVDSGSVLVDEEHGVGSEVL